MYMHTFNVLLDLYVFPLVSEDMSVIKKSRCEDLPVIAFSGLQAKRRAKNRETNNQSFHKHLSNKKKKRMTLTQS